jgi:hypothetical protein
MEIWLVMLKEPVLFRCRKNGGGVMKTQVYCLKDYGICFRVFRKRYHKRITKRWFTRNYRPLLDDYYITTTLNEENILKKQIGYKVSDILGETIIDMFNKEENEKNRIS